MADILVSRAGNTVSRLKDMGDGTHAEVVSTVSSQVTSPTTNISGSISNGGVAQQAAAANPVRRGFCIQNQSAGDLWVNTLGVAAMSQPSLKVPAGGYYETPQGGGTTGAISIIGATTGQTWSGREY